MFRCLILVISFVFLSANVVANSVPRKELSEECQRANNLVDSGLVLATASLLTWSALLVAEVGLSLMGAKRFFAPVGPTGLLGVLTAAGVARSLVNFDGECYRDARYSWL